jgi:hypothetical protein
MDTQEERIAGLEKALERARVECEVLRGCVATIREVGVRIVGPVMASNKVYCEQVKPFLENQDKMDAEVDRRIADKRKRNEVEGETTS